MKTIHKYICLFMLCLSVVLYITPASSHQPTPPISLDIKTVDISGDGLTAIVFVTPNTEVFDARLVVKTQEGVKVEPKEARIEFDKGETTELKVRIESDGNKPLRIDFMVEAKAKNYLRGGGATRRYLIKDKEDRARLITGAQLRDQQRQKAWNQAVESNRKSPKFGQSIYDLITGSLKPVRTDNIKIEGRETHLAIPPAGGIEALEADVIKDSTNDNIREIDPITVTGSFFYTDRNGVSRPMVNATVDIRDDDTFGDEQLTSVVTGWDGSYSAVVNADDGWLQNGRDIYVRLRTTNSRFRVQDCGLFSTTYSWSTEVRDSISDGSVVNFGSLEPASDMGAAIIFQDLNAGWNHMTSTGSQDPGFVNLCWPEGATNYDFSNVNITDGDEVAEDVVLHEYGHAIMHNAYNNSYWPSNAVGPHMFCDPSPQHRNLAFTEGWATFVALSINPDGVYDSAGWAWDIENNACSNTNGKRDETMVAAGIIDMRDRASDGNCSSGNCDPSGANRVSMIDLWRDTVFNQNIDDFDEYWDILCPELSEPQHDDAITSLDFNNISVAACQCTAELAISSSSDKAEKAKILDSLRQFRDMALKKTTVGKRMIKHYYAHHREATKLIMSNPRMLKSAVQVFSRVAEVIDGYAHGKGKDNVLLDKKTKAVAESLARQLKEGASSPEFRSAIEEAEKYIDVSSTVPLSRMQPILDRPSPK